MAVIEKQVIHLHQRDPQEALQRLNRITGLHFSRWPESLVPTQEPGVDVRAESCALPQADTLAGVR